MDKEPLVSICIPGYKGARLIHRALDSCLSQTYRNIEVVVVDDASPDNTVAIVQEYQKKSDKIKLYRNKKNLGASKNFLKTFELARGYFVQHLGQDDWLEPNHIAEKVAVFAKHPDAAFVANCQSAYDLVDGEPVFKRKSCKKPGLKYADYAFSHFYKEPGLLGFFCMMRKEDAVGQYIYDIPNNFGYGKYYEKAMVIDNLLLLRILSQPQYGGRYFYTDKTSYETLNHPEHFSGGYGWMKNRSVADRIKFSHIDRVGYEFFYKNCYPRHLFRYRLYMGYNTLENAILGSIAGGSLESVGETLRFYFADYSVFEKATVLIVLLPHLAIRIIEKIARVIASKFGK